MARSSSSRASSVAAKSERAGSKRGMRDAGELGLDARGGDHAMNAPLLKGGPMIGGSFRDRWFGWFALDPNPRFKLAHLLAGAAVALGVRLYPGCNHDWLNVIIIVALIGAAYELLETWDAGHGAYGANTLGNAGYGFSWRDVVTDGAGAIALGLAAALLRLATGIVLLAVLLLP